MKNKNYKRFIVNIVYKGYPVELYCTAKSMKEAAVKLGVKEYFMRGHSLKTEVDEPIDGVIAIINSGYIIFEYNRRDLFNKIIPYEEMKKIIDHYVVLKRNSLWEEQ